MRQFRENGLVFSSYTVANYIKPANLEVNTTSTLLLSVRV